MDNTDVLRVIFELRIRFKAEDHEIAPILSRLLELDVNEKDIKGIWSSRNAKNEQLHMVHSLRDAGFSTEKIAELRRISKAGVYKHTKAPTPGAVWNLYLEKLREDDKRMKYFKEKRERREQEKKRTDYFNSGLPESERQY